MAETIPFVKGHMGGNEIVLLNRGDLPREEELERGLGVLNAPQVRGDQLGLLSRGSSQGAAVSVKIVDNNSRDYLPVCGGITQVFGRAYREIELGEALGLRLTRGSERVELEMDMGTFPVLIDYETGSGGVGSVMDPFLDEIYGQGVEEGEVGGVRSYRVGHFFVTFAEAVVKEYPEASFSPIDDYTEGLLIELQERFRGVFGLDEENRDFTVLGPSEGSGRDGELIFPHNLREGLVEQSCGSGTVAAVVAMAERGDLADTGSGRLEFASGGAERNIGGPETTSVEFRAAGSRLESIRFSHSLVEVLARGELYLPAG